MRGGADVHSSVAVGKGCRLGDSCKALSMPVAVVTGANSGIGLVLARLLLDEGFTVHVGARAWTSRARGVIRGGVVRVRRTRRTS